MEISQNLQENTFATVSFLIKLKLYLKKESGTGVFQWILRNSKNTFFIERPWATAKNTKCKLLFCSLLYLKTVNIFLFEILILSTYYVKESKTSSHIFTLLEECVEIVLTLKFKIKNFDLMDFIFFGVLKLHLCL